MESREHLSLSDIRALHQGFPLSPAIKAHLVDCESCIRRFALYELEPSSQVGQSESPEKTNVTSLSVS
jgi:hypothetical protein